MKKPKLKIIKVIKEEFYAIEIYEDGRTNINGWTPEEVIDDWFVRNGKMESHATRNAMRIGGADRFVTGIVCETSELEN